MICYKAVNFDPGNSSNLAVTAVVGQHSRVTVHCYPLTSYIPKCCPLRDFDGKQFYWYMSCDLEVTNESARCWEKISSFITKKQLCYPRELFLSNVVLSKSIYMHNSWKRFTENSLGSPWSELGKQNIQAMGLFTWRWRTSGSWGNPLRSGNRPVHRISHFNLITFTW